jgi:peptidoglycan/LPS O-acetylase OafA/YrhL
LKTYYPTINLLRGTAALMVCLFHFIGYKDFRGELFPTDSFLSKLGLLGVNGVDVFFVISGFVIPLSLAKDNFNLKQLPRFLSRRFLRIEIPYIVSIFLILLVGFIFAQKSDLHFAFSPERFFYHLIYVIPFSEFEWYNVIYWTLAIEFQFYIAIGILYFFLSSGNKKVVVTGLIVFGLLGFFTDDNRLIFHYSTVFLQGIILFLIKTERITNRAGFVLMACSVIATAYLHSIEISVFSFLTVVVIQFIEISSKWTKRFGDLSYSLYLTHGLVGGNVLYLFSRYITSWCGRILLVAVAIGVSLLFSYIFWKLIENPSKRLSAKLKADDESVQEVS